MNTLRASSGRTSSREAFWLIAAIRRKERSGPGIVTVAVFAASFWAGSGESAAALATQKVVLKKTATTRTGRGNFMGRNPLFEI
jgi:hypothetical protein